MDSSAPAPTVDASLRTACKPGPDGVPVGELLVVRFETRATAADREAAAAGVGGRLAGEAPDGQTYVAPPANLPVRDVADRLIRAPGVSEVGEQPCP